MSQEENKPADPKADSEGYVSPAIEAVVTPQDMEREVHYAGNEISAKAG